MRKVLVTGASGFVGSALCRYFDEREIPYVAAVRQKLLAHQFQIGDISSETEWSGALEGCDTVIHLAARVHVMNDETQDPLASFRAMNVVGTMSLATQAIKLGIKRFVFVSSIKVNGEETTGKPFTAFDRPSPRDPYGKSKWEAEVGLTDLANESGLELVVVRPPLVYGPGVGANFGRLIRLAQSGLPLPFGAIDNLRSMVGIENLVDLLSRCAKHPAAAGRVFLASDGEDVSTPALFRMIANSMGRPERLFPVPPWLCAAFANALGQSDVAQRLLGSLQVDIGYTRTTLEWVPAVSLKDGVQRTVRRFTNKL